MKKEKFWIVALLGFIVIGAFVLLNMQIYNFNVTKQRITTNFDDRVYSALYLLEKDVEDIQIDYIFNATMNECANRPDDAVIAQSKNELQLIRKMHYAELVNKLVVCFSETADFKIEEQISADSLEAKIKEEFDYNHIHLPFYWRVLDEDGYLVYQSKELDNKPKLNVWEDSLEHALLRNEDDEDIYTIQVCFPSRDDYVLSTAVLFLPTIVMQSFLIVLVILVFYLVWKQNKLAALKTGFMHNMTHELKTPVTTIFMASQIMQNENITEERKVHYADVIGKETQRLRFLIDKVLHIMLLEKEVDLLHLQPVNANEVIKTAVLVIQVGVEAKGGSVVKELQAENAIVNVDVTHFSNVIYNLMENALKYAKQDVPPALKIKTWNEKNKFCFSIEDNGIGIEKENVRYIFEKFYRVPEKNNLHTTKGFGLGLAYVREIIKKQKGNIVVESKIHVGTKFTIILPTAKNNNL